MKNVAIIVPEDCYAPEVYALDRYLKKESSFITSELVKYKDFINNQYDFDLVYRMMGFSPLFFNPVKIPEIHDYASLATGEFTKFKDFIKKKIQKKPIHRFFLNEKVKDVMSFNDGISYSYRDMGVDNEFFNINDSDISKKYDSCYIGSITDDRKIDQLLDIFLNHKNFNIALVGDNNLSNRDKYINNPNIVFLGRKDREGVLGVLAESKIGINYTPDIFPFNHQTSTKVLEYVSAGLDVVSNHYEWINNFEKNIGVSFWDISDLNINKVYCRDLGGASKKIKKWDEIFMNAEVIKVILGA